MDQFQKLSQRIDHIATAGLHLCQATDLHQAQIDTLRAEFEELRAQFHTFKNDIKSALEDLNENRSSGAVHASDEISVSDEFQSVPSRPARIL